MNEMFPLISRREFIFVVQWQAEIEGYVESHHSRKAELKQLRVQCQQLQAEAAQKNLELHQAEQQIEKLKQSNNMLKQTLTSFVAIT
jgi:chromosome segregation ATPase